jgi:hypothetical protein
MDLIFAKHPADEEHARAMMSEAIAAEATVDEVVKAAEEFLAVKGRRSLITSELAKVKRLYVETLEAARDEPGPEDWLNLSDEAWHAGQELDAVYRKRLRDCIAIIANAVCQQLDKPKLFDAEEICQQLEKALAN